MANVVEVEMHVVEMVGIIKHDPNPALCMLQGKKPGGQVPRAAGLDGQASTAVSDKLVPQHPAPGCSCQRVSGQQASGWWAA